MKTRRPGGSACAVVALWLLACDGDGPSGVASQPDASGMVAPDGGEAGTPAAARDGGGAGASDARLAAADAPPGVGSGGPPRPEVKRVPADPALTRLLVGGGAALVGEGDSACSNRLGAAGPLAGDVWCAFSRPGAGGPRGPVELWAFNLTTALATGAPDCSGGSPACVRLTTNLWIGSSFSGPAHPSTHRFDGDTLIFHADTASKRELYQGPVWAWRPGWKAPRRLTSDEGVMCFGSRRNAAVSCIESPTLVKDPDAIFDDFKVTELDLHAGLISGEGGGPLPKADHVVVFEPSGALAWRSAFSPSGEHFVVSSRRPADPGETLRIHDVATAGAAPLVVPRDVKEWRLSHDGKKVYFLDGFDRALGEDAEGKLTVLDFPSGGNPVLVQERVSFYALLGARGNVVSEQDRGVVMHQKHGDTGSFVRVLRDRAQPTALATLEAGAVGAQVATDLGHALYFKDVGRAWPVLKAAPLAAAGAEGCVLNVRAGAETYAARFTDDAQRVAWIEFGGSSEEGYLATAAGCGGKTKFGDWVLWYRLTRSGHVVFEGGDEDDNETFLQVAHVPAGGGAAVQPLIIWKNPSSDGGLAIIQTAAASPVVVFTAGGGGAQPAGLYAHGPL